jgi:hypothetical protein
VWCGVRSGLCIALAKRTAGMGVDWGDYNTMGCSIFLLLPFKTRKNAFIRTRAMAHSSSAHRSWTTRRQAYVAFGLKWFDADNDVGSI